MTNEKLVNRENLKAFREKYDERLENGQVIPSNSLVAKELETISPESGDTQETPFVLQGTGTANGTSSVDTGTVGKHIQKQGSVYCINQQFNPDTRTRTPSGMTISYDTTTHNFTISGTASEQASITLSNGTFPTIANHKYLLYGCPSGGSGSTFFIYLGGNFSHPDYGNGVIVTESTGGNRTIVLLVQNGYQINKTFNVHLIDLTQWFNGNIPQDLLDHPEHWSWYQTYGDYIPYNTGTLVSGNGKWLVCGGRNIWDEQWEEGRIVTDKTSADFGRNVASPGQIRCKNYIPVIPSQKYYLFMPSGYNLYYFEYDKDYNPIFFNNNGYDYWGQPHEITLASNCRYIRFYMIGSYGGTYKNDITISLYYAGEDYSQYYSYEQPKVYDTGSEELLSTGVKLSVSGEREDIYDYKEPSGLITRRVKKVVFNGTENWDCPANTSTGNSTYRLYGISDFKSGGQLFITGFKGNPNNVDYFQEPYLATSYPSGSQIIVCVPNSIADSSGQTSASAWKTYLSNHNLIAYIELATPTTEQGTPFSENIEINDFGTMGWYATYTDSNTNELASVPQGCKIFYPAWYVGFIDTLGQRADIDWNANNVVSQSELENAFKNDVSSGLTDSASLTYVFTKIYKIGNLVFLTLRADNKTGSSIALGTVLFTLGSGLVASSTLRVFANVSGTNTNAVINSNGNVSIDSAIANNQTLFITCCYAVA